MNVVTGEMHALGEISVIVDQKFVDIEVKDNFALAQCLDLRRTELDVELEVGVVTERCPIASVLSKAYRTTVCTVVIIQNSLEPSRRQLLVDLFKGNPEDLIDLDISVTDLMRVERVIDDDVQTVIVKVWEGEQDVLTGVMQEIEVLPQIIR